MNTQVTTARSPRAADARPAVAALGTVLGIWAHPDDESYLFAGLAAMAVDAGNRVVCVTATRGERGTTDPDSFPPARLASLRTAEMQAAMHRLRIADHHWLDYRDGECAWANLDRAAADIAVLVNEIRPDTIVTFGPDGITGHPDHRAVSEWVSHAVEFVANPPRVLHAALTADHVDRFADDIAGIGGLEVYGPDGPAIAADDDIVLTIDPPSDVLDRKVAALLSHASQTRPVVDALGLERFRGWVARESFTELPPPPPPHNPRP